MSTAKEKAKELVKNYSQLAEAIEWITKDETKIKVEAFNDELGEDVLIYWNELAKQSALKAVDEILKANVVWYEGSIPNKYWQNVKKEIEKL